MGWGIGIGIGWPNASAGISYAKKLIKAFKERVLSYPNSIFEAEACLDTTLTELNAIGLLKEASLVITPNAYNEGILYDVVPNTTLGDMNVVRATTATRVNSAGLIEVVPRNLLGYSEQFDNIYWGKDAGFVITPNVEISPSGTMTADRLDISATGALYRAGTTVVSGTIYTSSIYIKAEGVNIGRTITLEITPTLLRNTITLTGEWQRISASTTASTSALNFVIRKLITDTATSFYIWGAQLEQGLLTEYFPTTTRLNIPRIDYTNGSCPSLLVEPQRTNLALNSDGNLSTYNTNVNVTNASSSFNSFSNAIQFPSTGTSAAYKTVSTTVQTYAISVFIKMDDNSVPILSASSATGNVCLIIAGSFVTNNLKVESYGNNVYRLSGTGASSGINSNNGVVRLDTQVLKSFKITGIQLEAGTYPTSYIPTVASIQTRNTDVISKTGISSLIGQTEGVMFVESAALANDSSPRTLSISDGTLANRIVLYYAEASNTIRVLIVANNIATADFSYVINDETQFNKIAIRYSNVSGSSLWINGINVNSNLSTAIPINMSRIALDRGTSAFIYFSKIKQLQLYKTALTDTELAQLTTI
jgi:hypothetical protein